MAAAAGAGIGAAANSARIRCDLASAEAAAGSGPSAAAAAAATATTADCRPSRAHKVEVRLRRHAEAGRDPQARARQPGQRGALAAHGRHRRGRVG